MDSQDDQKELLLENYFLKEQIELLKKNQENEKFEFENKIKNYEREITKLKFSLNSSNEIIEVYKVIDKQKENSEIKEIVQKLKLRNFELEQINLLLKKENSDIISELENLKMKVKAINCNKNFNNSSDSEVKELDQITNNVYSHKNFNSVCSTNQGSGLNINLNNKLSNETIIFHGKNDYNNKINLCPTQSNFSFENKENAENTEKTENTENSKKNNTKGVNINKINENEQCFNECENDINETDSIASDISFSSKNTMQIKEICLKIKREKNRIYENAVELMTENEIEIKAIKNENEDLKYALSKYEEEFIRIKSYLKDRHDINIDENEIFNIEEKSNENSETYNSNFQKNLNMNTENSLKKDIKAIGNNNDINSEYKNLGSLGDFPLNYEVVKVNDENHNIDRNNNMNYIQNELKIISEKNSPQKKNKTEEDKYLSSEKYNNSFEHEKNDLRNLIESLETKLFESSKNNEEKISKLKQDLENIELEKNQFQLELENIQSNKKNLVEDIEFYSVTVRSLQDQKEKLEDNLKNKIDYLIADNKCLEQTLIKNSDQILLLEKENKEIKEKETKRLTELKENFTKEKESFDAKFKELTIRYFECNKDKESSKKENDNFKQILERKKIEIDELIEKRLRAKEKKENEINNINEKYKIHVEKLESGYIIKINKYQEKIKNLYNIIEKDIEKINSLFKIFNVESVKRSKSTIYNKEQISKIKLTKNLVNNNFNEMKINFNDIYSDLDLQLSSEKINESPMEYENKQLSDFDSNENCNKDITVYEERKTNDIFNSYNNKDTNLSPINDQNSHDASINSKEYDLSISPKEEKIKFLDSENRKGSEFIDLYGFDPKKRHNSFMKSMNSNNFNSEISSNSIVNSYINNCSNNIPLAFALEDNNLSQNKFINVNDENQSKRRKPNLNFLRRKSSINLFKKTSRENIKQKLKRRGSRKKIFAELILDSNKDKVEGERDDAFKENMKEKFDYKLLKKSHEKEINYLNNKISEYELKIKYLNEEFQNIDKMLIINDLNEKLMVFTQENINLKDEIKVLKIDLETLEQTKNEYIQKLKNDVEKAEDVAAKAKFSTGQINFEKDSEVLKYRNYCKKLKIFIKTLESNNQILTENINNLILRKMSNKNS